MKTVEILEKQYPVKAFFTENTDEFTDGSMRETAVRNALLREKLKTDFKRIVYAYETHSGNVMSVSENADGDCIGIFGEKDIIGAHGGYDALVTSSPSVLLCVLSADCLPLFLYDAENRIAAIAHCGLRGVCNGIAENTVGVMRDKFGSSPSWITAAYGPCICENCYEVRSDIFARLEDAFSQYEIKKILIPKSGGKFCLDIQKAVSIQLIRSGVNPEMIYDCGICSFENNDFASFRRDGAADIHRQTLSGIVLLH